MEAAAAAKSERDLRLAICERSERADFVSHGCQEHGGGIGECEIGAAWYNGITIGVGGGIWLWCSVGILVATRCRRERERESEVRVGG